MTCDVDEDRRRRIVRFFSHGTKKAASKQERLSLFDLRWSTVLTSDDVVRS